MGGAASVAARTCLAALRDAGATVSHHHVRLRQSDRAAAWASFFVGGMILLMLLLLGRVAQLKVLGAARYGRVIAAPLATRTHLARRGDVRDARNRTIATSRLGYRLFVDPTEVQDPQTIAVDIAAAIGGVPTEIDLKILNRASPRYAVIDHLLEDWQADVIRASRLRGVGLEPRLVRHWPHGTLAASVVGTVGRDHTGLSGSEHVFESRLAHRDGQLTVLRDARRRPLRIDAQETRAPRNGRDVQLTIDLVVQQFVQDRLHEAVHRYNAAGGRAIVLRCRTGEILAMANVLNPRPRGEDVLSDPVRRVDPALRRNRCATDPYEPGSTFKPIVWAAATDLGMAKPQEILPTPAGQYHRTSRGRRIRDTHLYGPVSWRTVLVRSINSGMAIVAERMSHDQMRESLSRFGFGQKTRAGLGSESAGLVTSASDWNHYTQTSLAMGHEIAVTPLQMVRAFAAFARDGTLPTLRLTARDARADAAADAAAEYGFRRRACSESTARLVREVLREAMLKGTGQHARSQHYEMFGKSGTAQLPRPDGGGYFQDRYVSSFVAGAPYERPLIVVLCVIDDPQRSLGHWGARVAGPVVRDIVDRTLEYLGVQSR